MFRNALPASRDARRILVGTMFSSIGRGLTLPFLLIYLTQVRGLNAGTVGLLVGWMGVVALVLAPLGGTLVDRFGARRVVLPLSFVASVGTGSLALVHDVPTAFVSLTVIAIAFSALFAGQNTILASLVTEKERQRTFGLSFTLLNLGIGVGGLVAGSVVDEARPITFQAVYLADAISSLIPALILLGLPRVGRRAVVASPVQVPGETVVPAPATPSSGGYRQVMRDRAFMRFFIFGLALTTFGYAQIEVGFTAFATQVADVSPQVMGWAFAGNTLVIVVAQLFVLRWLEGRSRTRGLAVVGLIFAGSWVVLAGAGAAGQHGMVALAISGVIGSLMIFGTGEALLSPVMPTITNALAPDELRGRYNAVASMVFGVSGIIGPVAAGPLIGGGHATAWVLLVISGCLVAVGLALDLHRRLTPEQDGRPPVAVPLQGDTAPDRIPVTVEV
jgi:MFS family permease